jgi:KipI family sensor histidine kinase inhibitor
VTPRLLAAADTALVVELGDTVSDAVSAAVAGLDARLAATPPAGVVEVIPALRSLLIEYDPLRTSQARLRRDVTALLAAPGVAAPQRTPSEHVIDVVYDGEDLDAVSRATGLARGEVVQAHCGPSYRVAMLGNLPGLAYLLGLDERLHVPRRSDPRTAVPAGSVAIAGALSCMYPAAGPGGWNLLGHTDAPLFDAHRDPPALLAPGDVVRLVARDTLPQRRPGAATRTAQPTGPALHVHDPGLLTTVQDGGRHSWQRIGVPACGALDREWLHVANTLAGNHPDEAALEVTHSGPLLEVRAHSARIAVAGDAQIARIARDGTRSDVETWRSLVLQEGERVHVGRTRGALRCIVAIEGGVDVAPVLGSRATDLRSQFGGLDGRALQRGDMLPLRRRFAGHHPDMRLPGDALPDLTGPIRIVAGPQQGDLDALLGAPLSMSHNSDRTGLRLDGVRVAHRGPAEIISDGCAAGSVQVPGSGQPIVLLADRGTTGGYPKVATVASVDLSRLARLRPGDALRFTAVSVEQAEQLRRERETLLDALADRLEPVGPA